MSVIGYVFDRDGECVGYRESFGHLVVFDWVEERDEARAADPDGLHEHDARESGDYEEEPQDDGYGHDGPTVADWEWHTEHTYTDPSERPVPLHVVRVDKAHHTVALAGEGTSTTARALAYLALGETPGRCYGESITSTDDGMTVVSIFTN